MAVQAKFRCAYVDEPIYLKQARERFPNADHTDARVIHLSAVSETDGDNAEWSKWTPAGDIQMYVTNPAAFQQFEVGKSYYVTLAEV